MRRAALWAFRVSKWVREDWWCVTLSERQTKEE
jgi:hypothetical protein